MTIPSWYALRGIGRSPLSRMTVLIPVCGFIILFSSAADSLLTLSASYIGLTEDEILLFSKRNIYFLYFGLLLFSIATITYNAACPPIIKEFKNEYEFYDNEFSIITRGRAQATYDDLRENHSYQTVRDLSPPPTDPGTARAQGYLDSMNAKNREYWLKPNSETVYDLLHDQYRIKNECRQPIRIAISVLYLSSFVVIAVPTVLTLCAIISTIFR